MVLDTVLRSSLVLTIGFAIAIGLRRQPAALRHWILAASIVLAAVQPAITRLLPSWTICAFVDVAPSKRSCRRRHGEHHDRRSRS